MRVKELDLTIKKLSELFPVSRGIKHGYVLALVLINIYVQSSKLCNMDIVLITMYVAPLDYIVFVTSF